MTTQNEALRKLAEEVLHRFIPRACIGAFTKTDTLKAMLAFAAEQSALARQEAIADCLALCNERITVTVPLLGHGPGATDEWKKRRTAEELAEAIERLAPAGDRVMVPREPTLVMTRAASSMFYDASFIGTTSHERAAMVYKAMLAAAERKD